MKYFGTDGFRGEANVGLTVEHAYRIGRFVAGITAPTASARRASSWVRTRVARVICSRRRW